MGYAKRLATLSNAIHANTLVAGARFEQRARGGGARPRGGGAGFGRATPRTGPLFVRGRFVRPFFVNPFAFGAFGLGFAYHPFFWGWGYPFGWGYPNWGPPYYGYGYGYPYGYGYRAHDRYGSLKLDVKPRSAGVYADGYYVGQVQDFNGAFHHLDLAPGDHKIEIRANGYEPLVLNIKIMPGRTVNYHGELKGGPGK
jgi:hypothetical protein